MADTLSITIRDDAGRKGQFQGHIANVPLGDYVEFAEVVAAEVDAMGLGQIEKISIQMEVPLPAGLRAAPAVNSDVTDVARFIVRSADDNTFRVSIPTYNEAYTLPGTLKLNPASPAVAAFITRLELGSFGQHYGSEGEQVLEAYETVGKARKAKV